MITITINWKCDNCYKEFESIEQKNIFGDISLVPFQDGWGCINLYGEDQKLCCPKCYKTETKYLRNLV